MSSEIPAQYTGPLYVNDAKSITDYQPPVSRDEQRLDGKIMNVPMPKYPVNPVPLLDDPFIDDIPHDYVLHRDETVSENNKEKAAIFLDNGVYENQWFEKKPEKKKPNLSPLANHPVAQMFVGCVSVLGLFLVFRALKL